MRHFHTENIVALMHQTGKVMRAIQHPLRILRDRRIQYSVIRFYTVAEYFTAPDPAHIGANPRKFLFFDRNDLAV